MKKYLIIFGLLNVLALPVAAADNFAKDKLVAWCIVPFDAKKRGPAERAAKVANLGIKKEAYDWRR